MRILISMTLFYVYTKYNSCYYWQQNINCLQMFGPFFLSLYIHIETKITDSVCSFSFSFLHTMFSSPPSSFFFCFYSIKLLHQFSFWPWHWQKCIKITKKRKKNRKSQNVFSRAHRKSLSLIRKVYKSSISLSLSHMFNLFSCIRRNSLFVHWWISTVR